MFSKRRVNLQNNKILDPGDIQVKLSAPSLNAIHHASYPGEFLESMIFEYLIVSSMLISRILVSSGNSVSASRNKDEL